MSPSVEKTLRRDKTDWPSRLVGSILKDEPTVLKSGPYRFFFYSGDRDEPLHVHVERNEMKAKIWLDPVMLHSSGGFSREEINKILELVKENAVKLIRSWHEYFGD